MRTITLSPMKSAASLLLQLFVGAIFVFVGWDVCYMIFGHKGRNWMWLFEMEYAFIALVILICVGHLILQSKQHWFWFIIGFQLALVAMYAIWRFELRPYRALFVLAAFSSTILLPIPFRYWLRTKSD